jgi:hypothetical protein
MIGDLQFSLIIDLAKEKALPKTIGFEEEGRAIHAKKLLQKLITSIIFSQTSYFIRPDCPRG